LAKILLLFSLQLLPYQFPWDNILWCFVLLNQCFYYFPTYPRFFSLLTLIYNRFITGRFLCLSKLTELHIVVVYSLVISCYAAMSLEYSVFDVWIICVNSATESFMCIACFQLYWLILAFALSCHIALNPLFQCCFLLILHCQTLLSSVLVIIFIFFSWINFALCHMQLTIWMELENCNWGKLCFKR